MEVYMGENDVVCVNIECGCRELKEAMAQSCPHNHPHTYEPELCHDGLCSFRQKVVHCQKQSVVNNPSVHSSESERELIRETLGVLEQAVSWWGRNYHLVFEAESPIWFHRAAEILKSQTAKDNA
jgi:hypothetical protein